MISNHTIMGHMAIRQQVVVAANPRVTARGRPTVDRDKFPKCIVVPDFQMCRFPDILQVLRLLANTRKSIKLIPGPNHARPSHGHMVL